MINSPFFDANWSWGHNRILRCNFYRNMLIDAFNFNWINRLCSTIKGVQFGLKQVNDFSQLFFYNFFDILNAHFEIWFLFLKMIVLIKKIIFRNFVILWKLKGTYLLFVFLFDLNDEYRCSTHSNILNSPKAPF